MTTPAETSRDSIEYAAKRLVDQYVKSGIKYTPHELRTAFDALLPTAQAHNALYSKIDSLKTPEDVKAIREIYPKLSQCIELLREAEAPLDMLQQAAKIVQVLAGDGHFPEIALQDLRLEAAKAISKVAALPAASNLPEIESDPFLPKHKPPANISDLKVEYLMRFFEDTELARRLIFSSDLQNLIDIHPTTVEEAEILVSELTMLIVMYRVSNDLDIAQLKEIFKRGNFSAFIDFIKRRAVVLESIQNDPRVTLEVATITGELTALVKTFED